MDLPDLSCIETYRSMKAGGAGTCVGLVAPPCDASRLRNTLSPHWSAAVAWDPHRIPDAVGNCGVLVYAPEQHGRAEEERSAVVKAIVRSRRLPLIIYGTFRDGADNSLVLARGVPSAAYAIRGLDDRYISDVIIESVFRPLFRGLGEAVRNRPGADTSLVLSLAEIIEGGVLPFREAAALMSNGIPPFVRFVKDLGRSSILSHRALRGLAAEAGISLSAFLRDHALLQAACRYVLGHGYSTAVRLNFRSDDALRMMILRRLQVGLSRLHTLSVWPLVERLLGGVYARNAWHIME